MVFPKARSYAFGILALGGLLYLCPALRQDHLSSGPSDSEIEGGLWPEGLEGEGGRPLWEEEQHYQLQNRMFEPGHRWRGRALSKWKAVRNMLESASRAMEFSFFNIPFKHIL